MASVGIVVHTERHVAWELARDAAGWLTERGHEVRLPVADAQRADLAERAVPDDELLAGLDVLVGIGGDGTILRAVELAADDGVPVLGVNAGQLGYLATVEPSSLRMALKRFLAGSYEVEERMRLAIAVQRADGEVEPAATALNEAVLERADFGHTVRLLASFDGRSFTSYVADGMIVATPTGSTAYAFSVRGPIVAPRHRALVLVPVSPHMLFDRSMVLDAETEIRLQVADHRTARLSIDGHDGGTLGDGDAVLCTAARRPARLVTFGHDVFHEVLRSKFHLADR
jgi:NAD+ kinase